MTRRFTGSIVETTSADGREVVAHKTINEAGHCHATRAEIEAIREIAEHGAPTLDVAEEDEE